MKRVQKILWGMMLVVPLVWATPLFAQCGGNLLGCLDEESTPQKFAVSVWTNDAHCPASGHILLMSEMPEIGFGYYVDSFFDIFTEVHTVKPEVYVTAPPPAYMPFLIHAMVNFDDPAYTPLIYAEQVMWDPGLGRLVIIHPTPCFDDDVPAAMGPMTAACFKVCHRIYYVDLGSRLVLGRPNISVVPGCGMETNCSYDPCVPGGANDYVYNVYASGTRWIMEFEYSNPSAEPRCYCVSYTGNQPQGYQVKHLAVMNAEMQTFDLTLWTTNPSFTACGSMELFSYPPGAYVSMPAQGFSVGSEPTTWHIPVGAGTFMPDDTCMLAAHFDYGMGSCPEYTDEWAVEYVIYSTQKGARTIRPELSCDPGAWLPEQLMLGVSECLTVCHDIYYIPLVLPGPGIPTVSVAEGCSPDMTTCSNPSCSPGLPGEYRYDVLRIGGTWFLEFEHSNPQHAPACYCVTLDSYTPLPHEPYLLAVMNEAHQTLEVSTWSSNCTWPWHGEFTVTTNPPDKLLPPMIVQSFFDVFCDAQTWEIPVVPSATALPGENFIIEIDGDFFGPGSDPFEGQVAYREPVIVTPTGTLAPWNPEPPCTGDWVPPGMIPQQSQCFKVCHNVYETILYYNPGGGRPSVSVTPGCNGTPCAVEPCVPGGPSDYVATVYHDGVNWMLRFEYSNPLIEPVCYCVTYEGNVPYDCDTRELAALDEGHMQFEVSLRTFSYGGMECPADGHITIFSSPPGALIGGYPDSFFDVFTEWHTVNPPVDRGSFQFGEIFQLCAWIDYTDPPYPDRWLTEDVIVNEAGYLNILDVGGQCVGDVTPPEMLMGTSECFKVCHRIYHIPISDAIDPAAPPTVTVTPGCFGPPQDPCLPDPACVPGGEFDYRYLVWWAGDHWELEFEYSNEDIEPVCYCVSVSGGVQPPCWPVADLVVQAPDPPAGQGIRLAWTGTENGLYLIYGTNDASENGPPPSGTWQFVTSTWGAVGEPMMWYPDTSDPDLYQRYCIVVDCGPWEKGMRP